MPRPNPQFPARRPALVFAAALLWASCMDAFAATEVGIYVENPFVSTDDTSQEVSIAARSDERTPGDVHIVLIGPDGTIYQYPDWNPNAVLRPAFSLTLPRDFNFPAAVAFNAADVRGGLQPGLWVAAIGLAEPGTYNWIDIALARFQVVDELDGDGTRYGSVSLSRNQTASGVNVGAGGTFVELNGDLGDLEEAVVGNQPGLNECTLYEIPIDTSSIPQIDPVFLDAGPALSINGGSALSLPKDADAESAGAILYSAQPPVGYYVGNRNYRFSGPGGPDVGPFQISIQAPPVLDLIRPPVSANYTHAASTPLVVEWTGSSVGGEVDVSLVGNTLSTVVTVQCRFADDGNGTVPGNLISQLKARLDESQQTPGLPPIPGFEDIELPPGFEFPVLPATTTLSVSRIAFSLFNTSGGDLDIGIASINSSAAVSISLQ